MKIIIKNIEEFVNESNYNQIKIEETKNNSVIIDKQLLYISINIDGVTYEGWIAPQKGDIKCFMYEDKTLTSLVKTSDRATVMVKVQELIGMKYWPW